MKTVALVNLGCKVNYADGLEIKKILLNLGYEIISFNMPADIYIINTCSVTNLSDRKSRQILRKARKQNNNSLVIATGCYAQLAKQELINSKLADHVISLENPNEILDLLNKKNHNKIIKKNIIHEHVRAFVKIQDGCDNFCSYCVIPYARGASRSKNIQEIYLQAKNLCEHENYKEIVLTGINISDYGRNINSSLINLLDKLCEIKNLERIRLSSLEINLINNKFINAIKQMPKLCPHFHVPLQSGSDKILSSMKRKYNTREYLNAINLLREVSQDISITTDIIVGFPGETQDDFDLTCELIKTINFSKLHVFKFSPRDKTHAASLEKKYKVCDLIKKSRSDKLISLSEELSKNFASKFINKKLFMLSEYKLNNFLVGYTQNYIKIFLKTDLEIINQIFAIKISEIKANNIFAELI